MSNLRAYLKENRIRQEDFAAMVGTTQGTISGICTGARGASLSLAARIERATRGAVTATSLAPDDQASPGVQRGAA